MFKDYHYLARCVFELREKLIDSTIQSIFTQEKEKLFFHIPTDGNSASHLLISVEPQLPYLLLRNELHKAKKNTFNFFEEHLPSTIKDIRIAQDDRIINISTSKGDYFIFIRGGGSNILHFSNDAIITGFKKIKDEESVRNEIISKEFITTSEDLFFPPELNFNSFVTVKPDAPYISKKLFFEVKARCNNDTKCLNEYSKCVNEIIESHINVALDKNSTAVFYPASFMTIKTDDTKYFNSYNEAVSNFIIIKHKHERFANLFKLLTTTIEKEVNRLSSKLENLTTRVMNGSKDAEYYRMANLLLINLNSITTGCKSVELDDIISGKKIQIALDPKLSIQDNANRYFEKAKDEKKNYAASNILLKQTRIKYETYINFRDRINNCATVDDLLFIKDQLNIRDAKQRAKVDTERINCHKYLLDGKFSVVVGRDSKSNDMLTVKLAKQNDYWFHARGMPGSHVVLRVDNPKETVPKNILNATASIAAYYSKAKTAKVVPVSYTLRKFVRKNKNMNVGQVLLSKEKVLLVKPELPKIAEFIEE